MLVAQGLTLTLVGDMNQRRSHYTHHSWDEVADALNITNTDGTAPKQTIELGYRSTNQILRFASGLLPKAERISKALRDGPAPTVVKGKATELFAVAAAEAEALATRVGGLVAIITLDHTKLGDHLRGKGWRNNNATVRHSWLRTVDSSPILVLNPDTARGLEFDGVVVVEPHDFTDQLVKRQGVLYTSLTRATKELTVVHAKALPKELKTK
jgi:DNA helicase IV